MIQNPSWWVFLAFAPLAYWLAPLRFRAGILVIASFAVLLLISPATVAFMLAISLVVYFALKYAEPTPGIKHVPGNPTAAVPLLPNRIAKIQVSTWMFFLVLGYLIWYKYAPQVASFVTADNSFAKAAIPIGISYFSFKLMHYALERGRGSLPAHNLQDFISWMFLMPIFTSGPIERFDHFQTTKETRFQLSFVVEGLTRIAQGLVKRFILVAQLNELADFICDGSLIDFAHGVTGQPGALAVWAYLLLALAILYLDFSAYTDIAVGASRLFGFRIVENFNYPLLAPSLNEFWKRWHMSLTAWCRAYVYMPVLGMTRNPHVAVIATFLLVGLWHAGSIHWAIWGLWHGGGLALSTQWQRYAQRRKIIFFKTRPGQILGWAMTMMFVSLGDVWVAFYGIGTFSDSFALLGRAFGIS